MLLHHFDAPLPWKQSKMAAKQLFKISNLRNHSMQILKKSVSTNIMLSSFLIIYFVVIMLFLYFIVLFAFYACKNDTNDISNLHKTKTYIASYKSLGRSNDQSIHKHSVNFQDFTFIQG